MGVEVGAAREKTPGRERTHGTYWKKARELNFL
jgi:hypothetical protein